MICLSQPEAELHCSAMECETREEVIDLSVISASDEGEQIGRAHV